MHTATLVINTKASINPAKSALIFCISSTTSNAKQKFIFAQQHKILYTRKKSFIFMHPEAASTFCHSLVLFLVLITMWYSASLVDSFLRDNFTNSCKVVVWHFRPIVLLSVTQSDPCSCNCSPEVTKIRGKFSNKEKANSHHFYTAR